MRLLPLLLPATLLAASWDQDGTDKRLHAFAGATIALAAESKGERPILKYALVIIAAVGKEALDRHGDARDALATIAGASFSWTFRF